ncbi:MAG: hypothetical protein AAB860_00725 [Patescibacteria group bacterium]
MTNLAQFLLIVVIITLTILMVFVAIEVVRVLRDIRACVKNFKGKNTKELYKQIKEVASHPRHFFRRSGIPLKPS